MGNAIYPNSTPEFRIVEKDNKQEFQVRYVNISVGYTSKWQAIPIVKEDAT